MSSAYIEGKLLSLPREEFLDWARVEIEAATEELSSSLGFDHDEDVESFTTELMKKVGSVLNSDLGASEKGEEVRLLIRYPWGIHCL
jgi:hypothetical protein|tara:strand:- start:424 stop:684 length:261 start_codon:yes stop_codon:yes gene_type:complete